MPRDSEFAAPTRRQFLAGAGALTFLVGGDGLIGVARAAPPDEMAFAPNAWLRITADDVITIMLKTTKTRTMKTKTTRTTSRRRKRKKKRLSRWPRQSQRLPRRKDTETKTGTCDRRSAVC